MRIKRKGVVLLLLLSAMLPFASCVGSPNSEIPTGENRYGKHGDDRWEDSSREKELQEPQTDDGGTQEESSAHRMLEETDFVWVIEPSVEVDTMLAIADMDHPGYPAGGAAVAFARHGYLGLMGADGKELLPAEYADIVYSASKQCYLVLQKNEKAYRIVDSDFQVGNPTTITEKQIQRKAVTTYHWNEKTKVIVQEETENIYKNDAFVVVQDPNSRKYGLGNQNGMTTEFIFSDAGPSGTENSFFVRDEGGWHLVNGKGEDLLKGLTIHSRLEREFSLLADGSLEVSYYETSPYPNREGYYLLCGYNGKWAYFSVDGEQKTGFSFEEALPFSQGKAWVNLAGKWGEIACRE